MRVLSVACIVTAACLAASFALGSEASAGEKVAAGDEVVVAASRPGKLPTKEELAKADADAAAKAGQGAPAAEPQAQVIARLAATPRIARADSGQSLSDNPHQIHGTVSVSVGTGGYRSASASALIPVGEEGLLGIAVSQTDYGNSGFGNMGRYGFGHGGYGGYRYGDYGYGEDIGYNPYGYDIDAGYGGYGWAPRGGKSQSLSVSFDATARNRDHEDTPAGCAPGFRDGGRYIEPVWVTRMNGPRSCKSGEQP